MYIYSVSSERTRAHSLRKLGCTQDPIHRMATYMTGDPPGIGLEKQYDGIWEVSARTDAELRAIESQVHVLFSDYRQKRSSGNDTEWFSISFEQIEEGIQSIEGVLRRLSIEEVSSIHRLASAFSERPAAWRESRQLEEPLKDKFFRIFLAGKVPRRIQTELWDRFETLCQDDELLQQRYNGIVQWPTGTGKTIAMLLLIVLAKERCKRVGPGPGPGHGIYRGLLVSPRNDIFNTIAGEFNKLSEFGITLYDGSNAKLSHLTVPSNQHLLVMACPQSLLIDATGMKALPPITHVHYDEVHRITGELYFQLLKESMDRWNTQFLTGTSATPKTSSPEQHRKLEELFGSGPAFALEEESPYTILHKCDVDEAVREGWIATPRFTVITTPKQEKDAEGAYTKALLLGLKSTIQNKKGKGLWGGGKCMVYLPSIQTTRQAAEQAKQLIPDASIYVAIDGERNDKEFIDAPADGSTRILFACERYREGSDVKGVDLTAVLIGNTISAYILIQIQGRSLRTDYAGKEGWCLIVSPCEEEETEEDVLDRIALDILTFLGTERLLVKKDFERFVATYLADVVIGESVISKEETVARVQAAYIRREYAKRTPKERYETVRALNKEMGLVSKGEYMESASRHLTYIEDPRAYFKDWWVSWYHFLGIDTTVFPQTKHDWIRVCKELGITSWSDYKEKKNPLLPANPGELYEDYTNPDKEFGVEEEVVW